MMENFFRQFKREFLSAKAGFQERSKQELTGYPEDYDDHRIKAKRKGLPPALRRQQALSAIKTLIAPEYCLTALGQCKVFQAALFRRHRSWIIFWNALCFRDISQHPRQAAAFLPLHSTAVGVY